MDQFQINPFQMNQLMMNQIGMNNQQNQFNQMFMDKTTLEIKNIVQPYEKKIKELEEIIRQKDFEITVLKQKLNNNSFSSNINFMNINPMMMPQNMNPFMMQGNFIQQLEEKGRKIEIILKTENGEFENEYFEEDKASTLYEKYNINNAFLIYKYKVLNKELTLKENGIRKNGSIIYLKPDCISVSFKDNCNNIFGLNLSRDCPLRLALIYYLIKSDNIDYIDRNDITFLYNGQKLSFHDPTPIGNIILNGGNVVFLNDVLGALKY